MKNVDYKGKQLFSGDEYFIFENKNGFEAVNCEEVQEYLIRLGYYFNTDNYDRLKELIYINSGIHPETYLQNGEFR